MPLCNLSQCLSGLPPEAAVGCFSVYNLESLLAVVAAAEAEGRPAVVSLDKHDLGHGKFGPLAHAALFMARKADVPLAVHLNHGRTLNGIREALELGLPSVMFDGSSLAMEENVRLTREAGELAHEAGELAHEAGELAHEAGAEIEGEYGPLLVQAEDLPPVLDFLERTKVDFLAFSVPKGLPHSAYAERIFLLAELSVRTSVPLVLHGASRLSEDLLRQALRSGVCKVNVHTEILRTLARGIEKGQSRDAAKNPLVWLETAVEEVQNMVRERIQLYHSGTLFPS
ncbi:class II fructose-bisphosphate aldolase [Desulfonatronum thiodismutans]|uniref:class II fructose-bisphosphate aldolase n=1 Tax=Desulfonatronum thiodismutans TaxID=159290 RepID=UPI0004ABD4EC|nr:class II fructose-bisphosphate aldolase [Desulfonatronum thiodismutans]